LEPCGTRVQVEFALYRTTFKGVEV